MPWVPWMVHLLPPRRPRGAGDCVVTESPRDAEYSFGLRRGRLEQVVGRQGGGVRAGCVEASDSGAI